MMKSVPLLMNVEILVTALIQLHNFTENTVIVMQNVIQGTARIGIVIVVI